MNVLIASVLIVACTCFTAATVVALYRTTRRGEEVGPMADVPVTVLKPLCGTDDALEANLETFFTQTYGNYELVFGVEGAHDPAIAVVRRLREAYPEVRCRLIIHDGGLALNPKVSNLLRTLESGSHDIVLISDSNISSPPDYLERMVARLQQPGVGMVTSLFAGSGEETLGALLDNLHLNGQVAPSVALAMALGEPAVVGKSMMFRRSVLTSLGGFDAVKNVLAEDYVMGRMLHEAGYQVVLERRVLSNVNRTTSLRGFVKRHLRWGLLRSRLIPLTYVLEPLGNPMFTGLAVGAMLGSLWPLFWAIGLTLARDGLAWMRLRGADGIAQALPLGPLKDLMMMGTWVCAPWLKRIRWRHHRVRVSAGTRLYADRPLSEAKLLLVEESNPSVLRRTSRRIIRGSLGPARGCSSSNWRCQSFVDGSRAEPRRSRMTQRPF